MQIKNFEATIQLDDRALLVRYAEGRLVVEPDNDMGGGDLPFELAQRLIVAMEAALPGQAVVAEAVADRPLGSANGADHEVVEGARPKKEGTSRHARLVPAADDRQMAIGDVIAPVAVESVPMPSDGAPADDGIDVEALSQIAKFRDVVQFLLDSGVKADAMLATCTRYRSQVPVLERIVDLKPRVANVLSVLTGQPA